jgi:hypothetical protein
LLQSFTPKSLKGNFVKGFSRLLGLVVKVCGSWLSALQPVMVAANLCKINLIEAIALELKAKE